jgi:hypothetical protein
LRDHCTLIEKPRCKGREPLAEGSVSSVTRTRLTGSRRSPRPELPGRKTGKRARSLFQAQYKCLLWRIARLKALLENLKCVARYRAILCALCAPFERSATVRTEVAVFDKRIRAVSRKTTNPLNDSQAGGPCSDEGSQHSRHRRHSCNKRESVLRPDFDKRRKGFPPDQGVRVRLISPARVSVSGPRPLLGSFAPFYGCRPIGLCAPFCSIQEFRFRGSTRDRKSVV